LNLKPRRSGLFFVPSSIFKNKLTKSQEKKRFPLKIEVKKLNFIQ
jgi:hypothetical protein